MHYEAQTSRDGYFNDRYVDHDRWISYWHQLDLVLGTKPAEVVEVGPGPGIVTRELSSRGVAVTTVDVAADLAPDVVGSVTKMPLPDQCCDTALAAEILEHIRVEDVATAFLELRRVARHYVAVSVPGPGYILSFVFKIPLLRRHEVFLKLPFFWKVHAFDGQHYWELSKKGTPLQWFVAEAAKSGLILVHTKSYADDPSHQYFLFSTTTHLA